MVKKILALALALSFVGLFTMAPDAYAKRGGQPKPVPGCEDVDPGCHPED